MSDKVIERLEASVEDNSETGVFRCRRDIFTDLERHREGASAYHFAIHETADLAGGDPDGYMAYRIKQRWTDAGPGNVLDVEELVADGPGAYEELWRTEEAELWSWLEERVALDRVHSSTANRVLQGHEFQSKLVAEAMKEKQIDEAIRTTEEKLAALKHAVKKERETSTKSPKEEQT